MNKTSKEWGNTSGSVAYFSEQNVSNNSTILDIGCHTGSVVHSLWSRGYNSIYGIDHNRKSIELGRQIYPEISHKLIHYDGNRLPFEPMTFDVVTMFDVLEHIESVQEFLNDEVGRVLKNGGVFIFQTPNKYTNIPWEILVHKSFSYYKTYHVSLQSYGSLKKLLAISGFSDINIEKRNMWTPYYLDSLRTYFGFLAYPIVSIANAMPIRCTTNFWGSCRKLTYET